MRLGAFAVFAALQLFGAVGRADQAPAPPASSSQALPASVALPGARAREPLPEPGAVKVRINGEYEVRRSFLTLLPLTPIGDGPAHLNQNSRLFHWLRLRPLALFGEDWELRGEADLPRGMISGNELEGVPDNGTDFDREQPLRLQARMLRLTARSRLGELSVGHTTTRLGMGILDNDGDQPRWFGTPDRPDTYERIELTSGDDRSTLRVGASGDLAFREGRLSLADGDKKWRVALSARYAPTPRAHFALLARYEALQARGLLGGERAFVFDASGAFRSAIPGRAGELFGEYEAVYRVGDVSGPTAFTAAAGEHAVEALGFAARVGVALERVEAHERFAPLVLAVEWGMASGDADPTDDEAHRFVMNPSHGVGLLLFSELLRFKTSRAQALLAATIPRAAGARSDGLATRGGVAGASYLRPALLVRPVPDLALKVGGVVATSIGNVVDPATLDSTRERRNFDAGSSLGRSLGTELDLGAELRVRLDPPIELRLSIETGIAFPGSAFDDADGRGLGTQALTTAGLGLTF